MSARRNIISFAEAKHHIKNGKKGGKKKCAGEQALWSLSLWFKMLCINSLRGLEVPVSNVN